MRHDIRRSGKFFLRYPQFLISPMFSPVMYEGFEGNSGDKNDKVKLWKLGTIINAIYIGVVPPIMLIISDVTRGITSWKPLENNVTISRIHQTDSIFLPPYGNTVFALISIVFFSAVIVAFFNTLSQDKQLSYNEDCCRKNKDADKRVIDEEAKDVDVVRSKVS
jgi:hypothetical protein